MTTLLALGGDALCAPRDTLVAYWSALAAGADGLAVHVREARRGQLLCAPPEAGDALDEQSDAAQSFTPRGVDDAGGAVISNGPSPWAPARDRPALHHPLLEDVLRIFGRRTQLVLRTSSDASPALVERVEALLGQLGLLQRVSLELPLALAQQVSARWAARPKEAPRLLVRISALEDVAAARALGAPGVTVSWQEEQTWDLVAEAQRAGLASWLTPAPARPGLPVGVLRELADGSKRPPANLMSGALQAALSVLRPLATVFEDSLTEPALNARYWAAGFSRANVETALAMDGAGFRISMREGKEYSGGGLVSRLSVPGDFDVSVEFSVANPTQGTTFELAAIAIDPPRLSWPAAAAEREPNLVFDVHGAAPYASSERDEDDGYRIGWNNSSNLTRILQDWSHASANMFNQYGRDVGSGKASGALSSGQLRLTRRGSVFASYYAESATDGHCVCSGAASVPALPADVYLRLAAKHWKKNDRPVLPANEVVFRNFVLRQPRGTHDGS